LNLNDADPETAKVKGNQASETDKIDAEGSSISHQSQGARSEIEIGERTLTVAASCTVLID
jgi:hypothetical protein